MNGVPTLLATALLAALLMGIGAWLTYFGLGAGGGDTSRESLIIGVCDALDDATALRAAFHPDRRAPDALRGAFLTRSRPDWRVLGRLPLCRHPIRATARARISQFAEANKTCR